MIVKFWGVRGSIPTPPTPTAFKERLKVLIETIENIPDATKLNEYLATLPDRMISIIGGNTPCLEIRDGEDFVIIDAGTGINGLGRRLVESSSGFDSERLRYLVETSASHDFPVLHTYQDSKVLNLHLLLTHTHWDHIQGFPFFAPIFQIGNTLDIYGWQAKQIQEALQLQQSSPYLFPVTLDQVPAKLTFHSFPEGVLTIGPFEIEALPLPHPGGSLAFKIKNKGKTMVFATDYEFMVNDSTTEEAERKLTSFIALADVFISDTQYTYLESMTKEGWGHSSPLKVAEMALHAGVKKFFLFHHDPFYSDQKLFDILERTRAFTNLLNNGNTMQIELAMEGRDIEV
jgi:phosphoribosyl 1,2-cyclic phosphodiesterase